nr:hypothetical protein B0A51_11206 [Rachicladosporium sp. CCFEE 5018]
MKKRPELAGYSSVASAVTGFNKLMRAVMEDGSGADGDGGETALSAKKGAGRKRKGKDDDGNEEGEEGTMPAKKQKACGVKKRKGKRVTKADEEAEAEGAEIKGEVDEET